MKWDKMKWNEIKWNEMKRNENEIKWSEIKWNDMKWKEMRQNEMKLKWNEMKRNRMKWYEMKEFQHYQCFSLAQPRRCFSYSKGAPRMLKKSVHKLTVDYFASLREIHSKIASVSSTFFWPHHSHHSHLRHLFKNVQNTRNFTHMPIEGGNRRNTPNLPWRVVGPPYP